MSISKNSILKISLIVNFIFILIFLLYKKEKEKAIVKVPVKIEVPIPAKEGSFDTIDVDTPAVKENSVNKKLLKKYQNAKDSLDKLNIFKKTITEKEYNETFENDTIKIKVYSKVIGTLKKQSVNYYIKPSTVKVDTIIKTEIDIPTPKVNLYLGTQATIPTQLNQPLGIGVTGHLRVNKTIFSASYDTNKVVSVGVAIKIF